MTKKHALTMLLEHGPLDMRNLIEITGWTRRQVWRYLSRLMDDAAVTVQSIGGRRCYRLSND